MFLENGIVDYCKKTSDVGEVKQCLLSMNIVDAVYLNHYISRWSLCRNGKEAVKMTSTDNRNIYSIKLQFNV